MLPVPPVAVPPRCRFPPVPMIMPMFVLLPEGALPPMPVMPGLAL
jgi:hypothetical protein